MSEIVEILKALSDRGRLRILKMLEIKNLCVCEITQLIGLATPTVSSHLNLMKNAGLIADEKEGRWINYRLTPDVHPFIKQIWPVISQHLEADPQVMEDRSKVEKISRYEICGHPK